MIHAPTTKPNMFFYALFALSVVATTAGPTYEPRTSCSNYNVTILPGDRTDIAVKGYEANSDSGCSFLNNQNNSSNYDSAIQLNLLSRTCNLGWRVKDGKVIVDVIIRFWDDDSAMDATVSCGLPPAIEWRNGVVIRFSNDDSASQSQTLPNVKFGHTVKLVIDVSDASFSFDSYGVVGCSMYDSLPWDGDASDFPLINADGCKAPISYNPFIDKEDPKGFVVEGDVVSTAAFEVFKFPQSQVVVAKCSLIFCNSSNTHMCHQPSCQSSSMKRSESSTASSTATSGMEDPFHLDVFVIAGVHVNENGTIGENLVITNSLTTTTSPGSGDDACGTKCIVLVVVAVLLVVANAVAISLIVKKMIAKKTELKVVNRNDSDDKDGVLNVEGLDKLAPVNLAPSVPLASSSSSSTTSSSSASSVISDAGSTREVLPRSRCMSPIESPVVTVNTYNTYI